MQMFAVSDESGRPRKGYMGHLTRIANQLVNSSSNDGIGDSLTATNALLLGLLAVSCLFANELSSHSHLPDGCISTEFCDTVFL